MKNRNKGFDYGSLAIIIALVSCVLITPILYRIISTNGVYPSGSDTLYHIFRGHWTGQIDFQKEEYIGVKKERQNLTTKRLNLVNPKLGKFNKGRPSPLTYTVTLTNCPVFLPGEPHGQRSLLGYSLQGHKELDRTEVTQHARN